MRDPYRALLWSAPELLRVKAQPVYGTQKGDVYSFAILAQQIAYRAQPFFIAEDQNPKGRHRCFVSYRVKYGPTFEMYNLLQVAR